MHKKREKLRAVLAQMDSAVIAFSGGVDSTFLLRVTADMLGDNALAVTARSPAYAEEELRAACDLAESMGVKHLVIESNELENPHFKRNPPTRCYYCKRELFTDLLRVAVERDIEYVLDGSNADDCSDYRPGMDAARELGVRSPLMEADLTKEEIRMLSHEMGLPTWDKPSMACLASRFPYGEKITVGKLRRVTAAERVLRKLGFRQVRVRSHGQLARIEVERERVADLARPQRCEKINRELKELGFAYVTVDLEGYRSGSLNEALVSGDAKRGVVRET
jgi:uncharacterized protein